MIGVFCGDSERAIAREFFQLFKTPWEFYREGKEYQVIISSLSVTPAVDANLLIFYSSLPSELDARNGLAVESSNSRRFTCHDGISVPIYGSLASLRGVGDPVVHDQSTGETFAIRFCEGGRPRLRVGYDLFQEIAFLLTEGQPVENAQIPTLEYHIWLLREWILNAGIPLVEIPPLPWGYKFIACLTHDVDFVGIRRHKLGRTMLGFVYRAVVGSLLAFFKGTGSFARLRKNWMAVLSLPLVYLGLAEDFWDQFERYAEIDKDFGSTFFLIPFKDRVGNRVQGRSPDRRAARYDISDVRRQVDILTRRGYEIGLHGIDGWHCLEKARQELNQIVEATGQRDVGVRMHWLCCDRHSPIVLDQAGFCYDSGFGYNETIGYKAGTTQVFRPPGAVRLLELPLHIQDTALFYPHRLGLSDAQAWSMCASLMPAAARHGGVVTVLWHLRSLAPERLWGEFYVRLVQELRKRGAWFGTASRVVEWFRQRRSMEFEDSSLDADALRVRLKYEGALSEPRPFLRVHRPQKCGAKTGDLGHDYIDIPWSGEGSVEVSLNSAEEVLWQRSA